MRSDNTYLRGLAKEALREGLHPSDREIQQEFFDALTENGLDKGMAGMILSNVPIKVIKDMLNQLRHRKQAFDLIDQGKF
jgi:hypothetical protein